VQDPASTPCLSGAGSDITVGYPLSKTPISKIKNFSLATAVGERTSVAEADTLLQEFRIFFRCDIKLSTDRAFPVISGNSLTKSSKDLLEKLITQLVKKLPRLLWNPKAGPSLCVTFRHKLVIFSFYGDDRGSRVRFPAGAGIFLFTTASRTALGPTQPPIQWVLATLSLEVKRPGREADHSPPSSAEVKE
jgi:hypothetical protein